MEGSKAPSFLAISCSSACAGLLATVSCPLTTLGLGPYPPARKNLNGDFGDPARNRKK